MCDVFEQSYNLTAAQICPRLPVPCTLHSLDTVSASSDRAGGLPAQILSRDG